MVMAHVSIIMGGVISILASAVDFSIAYTIYELINGYECDMGFNIASEA